MSEESLIGWVKGREIDNGYIVAKRRTEKSKTTDSVIKVWLMCDRGGERNSIAIFRRSGSKKIDCPFQLIGLYNEVRESWKLQVINDNHNHEPAQNLEEQCVPWVPKQQPQQGDVRAAPAGAVLQPPPPPRGHRLVFRDPVLRDQSRRLDRLEDLAAWQSEVLIAFATHLGVQIPALPPPRQDYYILTLISYETLRSGTS
ncbi:hypothetical protein E3N88_16073 [Mikania micrantha]|uniref:FAR1 domain-containing protein n=1 Tax=Mikania micrantha TaxID=192012 RepID=A0A5N6NZH4_9ASTR|nr:hypothetical protein E3N88_16073 [Mikania micrantha]